MKKSKERKKIYLIKRWREEKKNHYKKIEGERGREKSATEKTWPETLPEKEGLKNVFFASEYRPILEFV